MNPSLLNAGQNPGTAQTSDEKELVALATRCSATAQELADILGTLKVKGAHKKRETVKKFLKSFREKKRIQEIEKMLDSYRSALDTVILVNLRFVPISSLLRIRPISCPHTVALNEMTVSRWTSLGPNRQWLLVIW